MAELMYLILHRIEVLTGSKLFNSERMTSDAYLSLRSVQPVDLLTLMVVVETDAVGAAQQRMRVTAVDCAAPQLAVTQVVEAGRRL